MNNVQRYIECYTQARECAIGGGCPKAEMSELAGIEKILTEDEKKKVDIWLKKLYDEKK